MVVEFRLLGDIEAGVNGRVVDLGPARRRCVLAVLLVEANRGVSVEELIERVWAQRPPKQAREVLHSYVSRLRSTLATINDVRIGRQAGAYVLVIDPMAVDVHRFRQLIAQARTADDDQAAAAILEEALGLWRGQPFAGLDTPWLNSVRDALERQRRAADLDRNDLALRRGDHGRLLVDLSTSAATHPLDERLAGQLMLALYRSGRQGDALELYQQMRRRLADELGADPGPPLQQLHQQILTTDPSLAAPTPTATRSGQWLARLSMPRQLPAPARLFTGRTPELAQLDAVLPPAGQRPTAVVISAVSGTAGIGKTALAVHWAHLAAEQFPDGQLYVNLRGFDPDGSPVSPAVAIRGFLDALDVNPQRIPADLDVQAGLYRSLLSGRRMLVVLDNARDAEQVRPLLPGAPGCLVLVTSRGQLTSLVAADGAHPLTLDLLSPDESWQLLSRRLGPDRLAAEPQAVAEIITGCARLPLALTIVAARAATHPRFLLQALADELRDSRDRLDALTGGDPASDTRAVFSWSYHALTPETARLFRLLGLHPGPDISTAAAASLAAVPLVRVRPLLAGLARANLIVEHIPGRYAFHDLLRAYATELAYTVDSDEQRHATIHRVLDHYLHTAHTAARLLYPVRDPITITPPLPGVTPEHPADHDHALAWFTAEHAVLLAAVDHAAATGFDTHTWQLAWAPFDYLNRRGHWNDLATTGRAAVAAAGRLADPTAQARAHRSLAHAYTELGRYDETHTHLRHALDLTAQAGDQAGQAHTHLHLAYVGEREGKHSEALHHAQQALNLFRAAGRRRGQADALNSVGWCHAQLGDHRQALTCCEQALTLFQEVDDRHGQAETLDSLGYAHHHLGHHTQAITCYQQALHLFRDLGDRCNEADTLTNLGNTHHTTENPHAARDAWHQALTILDQLGHPDADALRTKLHHLDHPAPPTEHHPPQLPPGPP